MWKAVFLLGLLVICEYVAGIPGGYEVVDVHDEGVVEAAKQAAEQVSKKMGGMYHHKLTKVVKAKRQVVAGMNYEMDIIVGMTNCKKAEVAYEDVDSCDYKNSVSTYKKCTVRVYRNLPGDHNLVYSGCMLAKDTDLQ